MKFSNDRRAGSTEYSYIITDNRRRPNWFDIERVYVRGGGGSAPKFFKTGFRDHG